MALETLASAVPPSKAPEEDVSPYQKSMQEYAAQKASLFAIQNNLMRELESRRVQPADKLMAFSQAMLTPGRTGNVGEAFGVAMGALQKTEAEEIARSQALAKMRMELGVQQLGMKKDDIELAKNKMLSDSIRKDLGGGSSSITGPEALTIAQRAGLRNGPTENAASLIGRPNQSSMQSVFENLDPRTRNMISQMAIFDPKGAQDLLIKFSLESLKTPDSIKELNILAAKLPPELREPFMQSIASNKVGGMPAEISRATTALYEAYDLRRITKEQLDAELAKLSPFKSGVQNQGSSTPPQAPVPPQRMAPSVAEMWPVTTEQGLPNVAQGTPQYFVNTDEEAKTLANLLNNSNAKFDIVVRGKEKSEQVAAAPAAVRPEPPSAAERERQTAVQKERELTRDKEFADQRASFASWTPVSINRQQLDLNELATISDKYSKAFNLLGGTGFFSAVGAAAQEGVRIGQASVQFPVEKFVATLKLNSEEKIAIRRAAEIISRQFFENAKQYKSAIGPQISNSDTVLMQLPMASISDPAKYVAYWAKENYLFNQQKQELYSAYRDFEKKNQSGPLGGFLDSPNYSGIAQKYNTLSEQLRKDHRPYR